MKIATWNVNSLRVRLPHLLDWLAQEQPDVVGLQELKCTDAQFPFAELAAAGYQAAVNGQKTYNGVALLAREMPQDVTRDLPGFDDAQNVAGLDRLAGLDADLLEHTALGRGHIEHHLVGFQLKYVLVTTDGVAFSDRPRANGGRRNGLGQLRHLDLDAH